MATKTDLVIVESPSKAKTIEKYLGPGYEVKASMGHVRDLPKSKLGVDLEGDFIPLTAPVTFFVGVNGSGKSTLLEAIAVAAGMNPEGGGRNFHFSTRESHSELGQYLTLIRDAGGRWKDSYFLRAESFFNVVCRCRHAGRTHVTGGVKTN